MHFVVYIVCCANFGLVFSVFQFPTIPSFIELPTFPKLLIPDIVIDSVVCKPPEPLGHMYQYTNQKKVLIKDGSSLNISLPTYFITHGWDSSSNEIVFINIAKALSKQEPCNIVMVDYSKLASLFYNCAPGMVKQVGEFMANFIIKANINYKLCPTKIYLIGHSLGGHASGVCGKKVYEILDKKIRRISALDPAGPLFSGPLDLLPVESLKFSDASFVDVLHTTLLTGSIDVIGHADVYAVGLLSNTVQWPCAKTPSFICSHSIANDYYLESITSCGMRAALVKSTGIEVPYGYHMPETTRGIYLFTPSSRPPYGKGEKKCP